MYIQFSPAGLCTLRWGHSVLDLTKGHLFQLKAPSGSQTSGDLAI